MTLLKDKPLLPPTAINEIMYANWSAEALKTAAESGLFEVVDKEAKDAPAIAKETQHSERGMQLLLDAVVALGFLQKKGDAPSKYSIADGDKGELARTYLNKQSPLYMGQWFKQNVELHKMWRQLPDVVKTGSAVMEVNRDAKAEEIFPMLAESIFPNSYAQARQVATLLKVEGIQTDWRVLDLASGSAVWSIPLAEASQRVTVDALDFPSVLEVSKRFAEKYKVNDRFNYLSGNWRETQLKQEEYDIVILGHILHSEGKELSKALLKRCFEVMKPGGRLVVAEMLSNDQRTGPAFPLLFALNMMLATSDGCVFTEGELKELIEEAGFVKPYRLAPDHAVVIAERNSES